MTITSSPQLQSTRALARTAPSLDLAEQLSDPLPFRHAGSFPEFVTSPSGGAPFRGRRFHLSRYCQRLNHSADPMRPDCMHSRSVEKLAIMETGACCYSTEVACSPTRPAHSRQLFRSRRLVHALLQRSTASLGSSLTFHPRLCRETQLPRQQTLGRAAESEQHCRSQDPRNSSYSGRDLEYQP